MEIHLVEPPVGELKDRLALLVLFPDLVKLRDDQFLQDADDHFLHGPTSLVEVMGTRK